MTSEAHMRVRRLAAFRAKERDRRAVENAEAQSKRDGAAGALEESHRALEGEILAVRSAPGNACASEALALCALCVESAGLDVGRRKRELDSAERSLFEARKRLLEAHRKVRQMEELAAIQQASEAREERHREQRELDDLAVVSEVYR
jgi:flagellar export protein FliJ